MLIDSEELKRRIIESNSLCIGSIMFIIDEYVSEVETQIKQELTLYREQLKKESAK